MKQTIAFLSITSVILIGYSTKQITWWSTLGLQALISVFYIWNSFKDHQEFDRYKKQLRQHVFNTTKKKEPTIN